MNPEGQSKLLAAGSAAARPARPVGLVRTVGEVLGLAGLVLALIGGGTALVAHFNPALTQMLTGSFAARQGADYLFHLGRAVSPQRPAAVSTIEP